MPWYQQHIEQHRQWHGRRSRSTVPREQSFTVTQDYPKRRRRQWDAKKFDNEADDESFVITDEFGAPSLVLSKSYFFEE